MDIRKSIGLESWANLPEIDKIKQFIMYRGFKMIQSSSINDLFVQNNIVISIRKLRVNENEKRQN